jgi:outer membrane protein with beta-barrel domain
MRKVLMVLLGLLVVAAPAAAQDVKPVDVNFGFGWAFPVSGLKDSFNSGWNGTIGATFNLNERVGFQGEYIYARMGGPDRNITLSPTPVLGAVTSSGIIESNHQMHIGSFNVVYRPMPRDSAVGGYVLGGAGIYHRIVQLTTPSVGYTSVCDPYWYVCYPALVSVDQIIGDRSSNDFGIDIGGGITFGKEAKFYIESRYHYVWGKSVTPSTPSNLPASTDTTANNCASGCSTNASYFPLTFGFRW